MTDEEVEMIEVPREAFLHMAYETVMESDEHDVLIPGDGTTDEFYGNISPKDVDEIEFVDDETMLIRATTYVREIVDRIPAGPIRNGRAVNPPEVVTKEREVMYEISFHFDGFGSASLYAEGV